MPPLSAVAPLPLRWLGGLPALYATQAEAERAAKLHFHCSGSHRMGSLWMPCESHP